MSREAIHGCTCLGGAVIDRTYRAASPLREGTSNPVYARVGFGGVARNVAENLARLGVATSLCSLLGDDTAGRSLREHAARLAIDLTPTQSVADAATAEYVAIMAPDGSLQLGLADMAIFDRMDPNWLDRHWPRITDAEWIFADCNLPSATIAECIARARAGPHKLAVDGVSVVKCQRLPVDLSGIAVLFVNADEAEAQSGEPQPKRAARALRQRGANRVVVTRGGEGLVYTTSADVFEVAAPPTSPIDVTGAGDALIAGTLAALLRHDTGSSRDPGTERDFAQALAVGSRIAAMTVASPASVCPALSPGVLAGLLAAQTGAH